jgi:hypothetical protein
MYLVLTAWWALVGAARTVSLLLAWWHVPDLHRLEHQAAADGLLSDHLRIHKAGRQVRTARGLILAACAVVVAAVSVASFMESYRALYEWAREHGLSVHWSARGRPGCGGLRSISSPAPT